MTRRANKRYWTQWPDIYSGRWRAVQIAAHDGDKWVMTPEGEPIYLGTLRHKRPGGPWVGFAYARRWFKHLDIHDWWEAVKK